MNNKEHSFLKNIKFGVILFIAFLLVAIVSSFAWFYANRDISLQSGDQMSISVGTDLKIALLTKEVDEEGNVTWVPGTFGNSLSLSPNEYLMDGTGDGKNFWFPAFNENEELTGLTPVTNDDQRSKFMIEYRVRVRTTTKIDVFLSKESFISPLATDEADENYNKSNLADFSANYIAGCSRVSFLEVNGQEEELKFVWAPNPNYEVTKTVSESNRTSYEFTESGKPEDSYGYLELNNEEIVEKNYTIEDYLNRKFLPINSSEFSNGIESRGSGTVLSFEEDGKLQEKDLIIRVWFEGTDREAESCFNYGLVKYNFSFVGILKESALEEEVAKLDDITFSNGKLLYKSNSTVATGISWSSDGLTWRTYNDGYTFSDELTNNINKIYIKTTETETNFASDKWVSVSLT